MKTVIDSILSNYILLVLAGKMQKQHRSVALWLQNVNNKQRRLNVSMWKLVYLLREGSKLVKML